MEKLLNQIDEEKKFEKSRVAESVEFDCIDLDYSVRITMKIVMNQEKTAEVLPVYILMSVTRNMGLKFWTNTVKCFNFVPKHCVPSKSHATNESRQQKAPLAV